MSDPTPALPADPLPGPDLGPLEPFPPVPVLLPAGPLPWFLAAHSDPLSGDRSAILGAAVETAGISRKLDLLDQLARRLGGQLAQVEADPQADQQAAAPPAYPQGGGNLNGTAALILAAQAGTSGQRIAVPRATAGNFCGVV